MFPTKKKKICIFYLSIYQASNPTHGSQDKAVYLGINSNYPRLGSMMGDDYVHCMECYSNVQVEITIFTHYFNFLVTLRAHCTFIT